MSAIRIPNISMCLVSSLAISALSACHSIESAETDDITRLGYVFSPQSCDHRTASCAADGDCLKIFRGDFHDPDNIIRLVEVLEENMTPKRRYPPVFVPHYGRWFEIDYAECSLSLFHDRIDRFPSTQLDESEKQKLKCRAGKIEAVYKAFAFSYPIEVLDPPPGWSLAGEINVVNVNPHSSAAKCEFLSGVPLITFVELLERQKDDSSIVCSSEQTDFLSIALSSYFEPPLIDLISSRVCAD